MSDCKDIAEIIADYRLNDRKNGLLNIKIDKDHVERWIEQFPQNQDIILGETKKLLGRYYFSQERVYKKLRKLATTEKLWDDPEKVMTKAYFLDCQTEGQSQRQLLDMMAKVVWDKYKVQIKRTDKAVDDQAIYIYLDDGLFSGRTLFNDMASFLPHVHEGSKIWSIFLIAHSFGEWWVMENVQKNFDIQKIGFYMGYFKTLSNSDGNNYPFDCLRPTPYKSDLVDEYIRSLNEEKENNPDKKLFTFRNSARPASTRFDSEENRSILEQELMEAGLKICNFPKTRTQYMRPMGFDNRITFGLGAYFATFMNMSNNCPLAYWWGDAEAEDWHPFSKWYPLLPRRAHVTVGPCAW